MWRLQGYLAHKKTPYPRNLPYAYAYGPMTVHSACGLGGAAATDFFTDDLLVRIHFIAEMVLRTGLVRIQLAFSR